MNKVLIAEPIYSGLHPEVYFNRIAFWKETFEHQGAVFDTSAYSAKCMVMGPRRAIRSARDEAIKAAIKNQATHLLFLDDDILVPPNILRKLLEADKDIIGGLMHRDDGMPIVFADVVSFYAGNNDELAGPSENNVIGEMPWEDHPRSGVFQCAAVGAGCMLIKTEVLIKMRNPGPYYLFNYDSSSRSMDVLFCRAARAQGFGVYCWPDVPCKQIKHY